MKQRRAMLTTGALAGPVPRLTTQRRRRLGHYTGYARRYWRKRGFEIPIRPSETPSAPQSSSMTVPEIEPPRGPPSE